MNLSHWQSSESHAKWNHTYVQQSDISSVSWPAIISTIIAFSLSFHSHSDFNSNFSFAMATHTQTHAASLFLYIHENSISGTNVKYLNYYNIIHMPIHAVLVRGIWFSVVLLWFSNVNSMRPFILFGIYQKQPHISFEFQNNWQTFSVRIFCRKGAMS